MKVSGTIHLYMYMYVRTHILYVNIYMHMYHIHVRICSFILHFVNINLLHALSFTYSRDVWTRWDGPWAARYDDASSWNAHDGYGTRGIPAYGWPTHGHVLLQPIYGRGHGILW